MKLFKKREKVSSGVTCLCTSDKQLFVGGVDDAFSVLDLDYKQTKKLRVELGAIDAQFRNGSRLKRARGEQLRERDQNLRRRRTQRKHKHRSQSELLKKPNRGRSTSTTTPASFSRAAWAGRSAPTTLPTARCGARTGSSPTASSPP